MATWKETHGVPGVVLKFKPGTTKETPVVNETNGTIGGKHVEHHDGRVDAEIRLQPINAKAGTQ